MAMVIEIPCPSCEKVLKVPESVFGKKIKCKHCGEPIQVDDLDDLEAEEKKKAKKPSKPGGAVKVKKEEPKKEEPKKEEPKPAAAPYKFEDDDDQGGAKPNPLKAIEEEDVARCPFCAKELDPPDAKVCLHCGFNNLTRERAESKRVWAPDSSDYMNHLGPGVAALFICIVLIVLDIICLVNMRDWLTGSFLETDEADPTNPDRKKLMVRPGAFITLIWAATVMPIIGTARFAIKRLAIDNKPMEKVKK